MNIIWNVNFFKELLICQVSKRDMPQYFVLFVFLKGKNKISSPYYSYMNVWKKIEQWVLLSEIEVSGWIHSTCLKTSATVLAQVTLLKKLIVQEQQYSISMNIPVCLPMSTDRCRLHLMPAASCKCCTTIKAREPTFPSQDWT